MNEQDEEPKIIVDTDWKEQVAREKEAANEDDVATPVESTAPSPMSDGEPPEPPPASFEIHISMLFTQAMSMLGLIPDPAGGETKVNKTYAKHYIDTLEMLSEKTAGNLSDDESKMLSQALHELRMAFVNVKG